MTGMKSGAGDDPFADVTDDEGETDDGDGSDRTDPRGSTERPAGPSESESATTTDPSTDRTRDNKISEGASTSDPSGTSGQPQMTVEDLPYIARRNVRGESVKTGRDKNVLFELRPEIAEREEEFVAELERRLGTDVPKTDAREAALAAIWDRPEDVVPILEEWGLGYFDD